MKKAFFSVLCMMMLCWIVPSVSVQAAEGWEYEYSGVVNYRPRGNVYSDVESFTIRTHYPIYGYLKSGNLIYACLVPDGDFENDFEIEISRVVNDGNMQLNPNGQVVFLTSEVWLSDLKSGNSFSFKGAFFNTFNDYTVTFPVFSSTDSLADYLETGNESGWINKPDVDYSVKHDFSKDVYDSNIPVPELSNLSYNGFSITNREDYYIDVIVDYSLLGVKTYKKAFNTYRMDVDEDWEYTSHYYNFTLDNRAVSQDLVNINNIYGVDIEHGLIEDFKSWSAQYPDYKKLPTYSFFAQDINFHAIYDTYHVYKESGVDSDLKQLQDSGQGLIFYYVRFYNNYGDYGQWVRYSFRTSGGFEGSDLDSIGNINQNIKTDLITVGTVKSDTSGKPIVDNEIKGFQSKDSGDIGFKSSEYIGLDITDVNSYFSYIRTIFNNISSSLDSFGSLVTACFGFLPQEVVGLIIFGIVLMVFVGIVKAVIS